ncbi:hypothetical protein ASPBRDRAFT_600234 [Aspergillus brasiliensis CBS 101740]|uniref:Uncharacterized protein n=1 Tax=Aspergillus brasiliensis (strain CBS 101740 / IMI 381727 / IBT 21946) TaxID=767769 RepID=A0A1L9UHE0_ASPBC|nr:hypothetical protein ASPBRDRAFT_600234 [Aspergillus brasiliensis CBS 101740]
MLSLDTYVAAKPVMVTSGSMWGSLFAVIFAFSLPFFSIFLFHYFLFPPVTLSPSI